MLCSECYKKISQGAEVQISGTIFCKGCAEIDKTKRGMIICNNCSKLVSGDELIHEVHKNWGDERTEKLIVCQSCYEEWLKIAKSKKKVWKMTRWFTNISLPFNTWLILAAITIDKNRDNVGWVLILSIVLLSISVFLSTPLFDLFFKRLARWLYERKYRKELKKLRNERRKLKQEKCEIKNKEEYISRKNQVNKKVKI